MSRYLTYQPWQGQLNNTRMCFETALVMAWLSRRCLVLPGEYRREHEPEVQAGRFRPLHPEELFTLETLRGVVEMISREEYDRRTETEGRGDQVDLVLPPETSVFCYPAIPEPGSAEAQRLREFAVYRRRFLEFTPEMNACRTLNVERGLLDPFYAFFFITEPEVACESKRLIRDHLMFRPHITSAAARVADALGDYCALHIRRNDFFQLYPEQDIPAHRLLGNVMMRVPAGARIFIASDEPDRGFFTDLALYYDLRFIGDCEDLLPRDLPAGALACVEQMICANARTFIGTRLSTFSAYITRLRGYLGAADPNIYFTDGSPGSDMDYCGSPPFSWINWLKKGYPLWGREFREGWEI